MGNGRTICCSPCCGPTTTCCCGPAGRQEKAMRLGRTLGILLAILLAPPAHAWPDKPLKFIVSFAPGTATDNLARVLADALTASLGQPIVIDNKPGAQGSIGANQAAKAAPDGYTLLIGSATTQAAAASLLKSIPYDPAKDFAPVTQLGHIAQVLIVKADSPYRDVAALIAAARAQPGKLNYGQGSSGNLLPSATLVKRLGLDVAIADTLKGFELLTWFAMYAPAGTPAAIVDTLNIATRKALADPVVAAKLVAMGFEMYASTPADLGAFTTAEVAKWKSLVAETGIEQE
ncbi:MAG: hypothetical protein EBY18_08705 [Alphaproteobacteria bacterium]|nr:hypothetical protein [Alphaproteobacteria bacterium]